MQHKKQQHQEVELSIAGSKHSPNATLLGVSDDRLETSSQTSSRRDEKHSTASLETRAKSTSSRSDRKSAASSEHSSDERLTTDMQKKVDLAFKEAQEARALQKQTSDAEKFGVDYFLKVQHFPHAASVFSTYAGPLDFGAYIGEIPEGGVGQMIRKARPGSRRDNELGKMVTGNNSMSKDKISNLHAAGMYFLVLWRLSMVLPQQAITERENHTVAIEDLEEKNQSIRDKNKEIRAKNQSIREKNKEIKAKNQSLRELNKPEEPEESEEPEQLENPPHVVPEKSKLHQAGVVWERICVGAAGLIRVLVGSVIEYPIRLVNAFFKHYPRFAIAVTQTEDLRKNYIYEHSAFLKWLKGKEPSGGPLTKIFGFFAHFLNMFLIGTIKMILDRVLSLILYTTKIVCSIVEVCGTGNWRKLIAKVGDSLKRMIPELLAIAVGVTLSLLGFPLLSVVTAAFFTGLLFSLGGSIVSGVYTRALAKADVGKLSDDQKQAIKSSAVKKAVVAAVAFTAIVATVAVLVTLFASGGFAAFALPFALLPGALLGGSGIGFAILAAWLATGALSIYCWTAQKVTSVVAESAKKETINQADQKKLNALDKQQILRRLQAEAAAEEVEMSALPQAVEQNGDAQAVARAPVVQVTPPTSDQVTTPVQVASETVVQEQKGDLRATTTSQVVTGSAFLPLLRKPVDFDAQKEAEQQEAEQQEAERPSSQAALISTANVGLMARPSVLKTMEKEPVVNGLPAQSDRVQNNGDFDI